ncbi:unnamed protein product [Mycena citricolor]|uniref:Peptidase A1 domain-containing protein n=1 Tax=Mycena citricolor TaxID=2018698 RepID=A0AAD2HDH3_9AGAR|nr:unnamed protein product [Mycena citricolor]
MHSAVALFSLVSFLLCTPSSAVKLAISRPPKASANVNGNLINKGNLRYTANITISGRVVNVALDTGSTDLWVMPPEGVPKFNDTHLNATLRYGDGSDYVFGDIGVGQFQLNQYTIPHQAYLNVFQAAAAEDADFADGIFGLWGLGFDTPGSSGVNDAIQTAYGPSAKWGQSVLANIFAQDPTKADYIGIALSRSGDAGGTADASLTISEYDSDYDKVASSPKIPQTPADSGAWTVPLDGMSVGGKKIDWPTTMRSATPGSNIVHLDTGTTNVMMPAKQVAAIYGSVPNAVFAPNDIMWIPQTQYSTTNAVWVVPCNASISVVATFGGQDYAIHPLDMTDMQVVTSPDGTRSYTVCIGTFTDVGAIVSGASDALFGDSFLRNTYTVFDFATGGNAKPGSKPFVQMLSVTDASKAQADLLSVRSTLMQNMPPEIDTVDFVKIFNLTKSAGKTGAPAHGGGGGGSSSSAGSGSSAGSDAASSGASSLTFSFSSIAFLSLAVLALC